MAVWRTGGDPFDDARARVPDGLSRQATVALQNARLFNETRRRSSEQTADRRDPARDQRLATDTQPVFDAIVDTAASGCSRLRLVSSCAPTARRSRRVALSRATGTARARVRYNAWPLDRGSGAELPSWLARRQRRRHAGLGRDRAPAARRDLGELRGVRVLAHRAAAARRRVPSACIAMPARSAGSFNDAGDRARRDVRATRRSSRSRTRGCSTRRRRRSSSRRATARSPAPRSAARSPTRAGVRRASSQAASACSAASSRGIILRRTTDGLIRLRAYARPADREGSNACSRCPSTDRRIGRVHHRRAASSHYPDMDGADVPGRRRGSHATRSGYKVVHLRCRMLREGEASA